MTITESSKSEFSTRTRMQALIADAQSLQATLGTQVKVDPIVGSVMSASNPGISGLTVNLLSAKKVIATATTDAVGFYYLDGGALTPTANYTVNLTLPKGYKASTPASQTFTWSASPVKLDNFVLN